MKDCLSIKDNEQNFPHNIFSTYYSKRKNHEKELKEKLS